MPLSRKPLLHVLDHFRQLCPHNFCPASINPFFYVNFVSCIIQYFYSLFGKVYSLLKTLSTMYIITYDHGVTFTRQLFKREFIYVVDIRASNQSI